MSPLVAILVFLSGAAALVYETVWLRQAAQAMGQTAAGTTAVLAAWMGGLALGAALMAPRADRARRPLACYGGLELSIALMAGLVTPALAILRRLDLSLAEPMGATGSTLAVCGLAAVMLPVTLLMGATVPLLVRIETDAGRSAGSALGRIGAINTAGAVAGALLAGFVLVEELGLSGAVCASRLTSAVAGVVALLANWGMASGVLRATRAGEVQSALPAGGIAEPARLRAERRTLTLHVFLAGFSTMLFEVCLLKILPLVLGSSLQSSATVLSALLAGLAVGSSVGGVLARRCQEPTRALAALLCLIGLALLAAVPCINLLPIIYGGLRQTLNAGFLVFHAATFGVCFLLVLLPATCMGAVLPIAVEAARAREEAVASTAGRLYAASALGNLVGVVATGLALVPGFGSALSLKLGGVLAVASGVALLRSAGPLPRLVMPLATAALGGYVILHPELAVLPLTGGVFQRPQPGSFPEGTVEQRLTAGRSILFCEEDDVNLVSVERSTRTGARSLRVNGKVDASTTEDDMRTQKLLAHAPLLLHASAQAVLVIGLGSGVTIRSALRHGVKTVDCVEISRAVVSASRWFSDENGGCLLDPRVTLILDDGRRFVERTSRRYDVVISEPSNPWMSGVGNLYTVEFFARARERLNAGGLMCQWIHTYNLDTETLAMVMRTFRAVFPSVQVLRLDHGDLALVGSMARLEPVLETLAARMKRPALREELGPLLVSQPLAFLGLQLIAAEDLDRFTGTGDVQTDDRPALEYRAARTLHSGTAAVIPEKVFRAATTHGWVRRQLESRDLSGAELIEFCELARKQYDTDIYLTLLQEIVAMGPGDPLTRVLLAESLEQHGDLIAALDAVQTAVRQRPENLQIQRLLYRISFALDGRHASLVARPEYRTSIEAALACMKLAPDDFESHLDLGVVRLRRHEWREAESALRAGVAMSMRFPERAHLALDPLHLLLAQCRFRQGDLSGAWQHLEKVGRGKLTKPEYLDLERLLRNEMELARRSAGQSTIAPVPAP